MGSSSNGLALELHSWKSRPFKEKPSLKFAKTVKCLRKNYTRLFPPFPNRLGTESTGKFKLSRGKQSRSVIIAVIYAGQGLFTQWINGSCKWMWFGSHRCPGTSKMVCMRVCKCVSTVWRCRLWQEPETHTHTHTSGMEGRPRTPWQIAHFTSPQ